MRIVTNEDLRPYVGIKEVLDAYETVLREYYDGNATRRPRIDVWSPTSNPNQFYQWGTMEGLSRHYGVFATRMKSDVAYFQEGPDGTTREKFNTRRGLYCGLIMAFDIETGAPLALIHDGHLQHLRVGAKAGLAAREGATEDAGVVGMLGSGGMARTHLRAFDQVRNLEQVSVYSPTPENRQEYADEMSEELGLDVDAVDAPEAAVSDADIIACCTDASEPVLRGEWIPKGAFITNVKSTSELDDDAWEHIDHLINFSAEPEKMKERQLPLSNELPHSYSSKFESYAAGKPEDYAQMPERDREPSHPQYEMDLVQFADIVNGTAAGRDDDDQIVSYGGPASGQGIQFAAVAGLACDVAADHDLGHVVPNELILEAERN